MWGWVGVFGSREGGGGGGGRSPPPPAQYAEPTLLPFCPPRLRATSEGRWVEGADFGEEAADVTAGDPHHPPSPSLLPASNMVEEVSG